MYARRQAVGGERWKLRVSFLQFFDCGVCMCVCVLTGLWPCTSFFFRMRTLSRRLSSMGARFPALSSWERGQDAKTAHAGGDCPLQKCCPPPCSSLLCPFVGSLCLCDPFFTVLRVRVQGPICPEFHHGCHMSFALVVKSSPFCHGRRHEQDILVWPLTTTPCDLSIFFKGFIVLRLHHSHREVSA